MFANASANEAMLASSKFVVGSSRVKIPQLKQKVSASARRMRIEERTCVVLCCVGVWCGGGYFGWLVCLLVGFCVLACSHVHILSCNHRQLYNSVTLNNTPAACGERQGRIAETKN